MPAFTYAASVIVAQGLGITFAAAVGAAGVAFTTSVIALGLALVTARVFGLTGGAGGTQQDPGVRIQFPPGTTNKIPIVYGNVKTKGIVTDARISNENRTMTYVLALSEKTQTGVFEAGDVWWNDQLLLFRNGTPGEEHIVAASLDQKGQGAINYSLNGLIRIRIYAGGVDASNQIFPEQSTGNTVSATSVLDQGEIKCPPGYALTDIVFAVVQLDYSSEKGVTGLAQMTYQIVNSLSNPGLVWYDLMTSSRYGLGIASTQINTTTSISAVNTQSVYSISNEIPPTQYEPVVTLTGSISGTTLTVTTSSPVYGLVGSISVGDRLTGNNISEGTFITAFGSGSGYDGTYVINNSFTTSTQTMIASIVSQQPRYQINGVLSTGDTVKNNLDKISLASECWTTYDYGEGKWKLIANRPIPAGELAEAFEFNDDNILGDVSITATNLEDLYNILETEFPSRVIRDQSDYFRAAIDPVLMNDLEPSNKLSLRLDMVNNALHAARVGLIELKQSRADLIITFKADYTALQCSAGDVVKITNSVYGFVDELFRISKIRELEDDVGSISVDITATKYNASVYADEILDDSSVVESTGIPVFGGLPAPSEPIISSVNTSTRSFVLTTTINPVSGPVNEVQWFYSTSSATGYAYLTNEVNTSGNFAAGSTVTDNITILTPGNYYFKARAGLGARYGDLSVESDLLVLTEGADFGTIVP
jgi:hypothetical protein